MKQELTKTLQQVAHELFKSEIPVELSRSSSQFGDLSTNIALKIAQATAQNPKEVAAAIVESLQQLGDPNLKEISLAGPGFINLQLSDQALTLGLSEGVPQTLAGQVIVSEYSDPNPFKVLHAGHIYTTVIGDAISNLMENAGGEVHRVNFGGDVGLHVAKTMWAILNRLGGANPAKLADIESKSRSSWLTECYIAGNLAYQDEANKPEIIALNKQIYGLHEAKDHESAFAQIYWTTRDWSYAAFNDFYEILGTKVERYYPESATIEPGKQAVEENIGKVFTKSKGAVVFEGEKYGLHTRVFINSEGLPTYETKDVGLIIKKFEDYKFDKSVVILGNEQAQYMAVVLKAISLFLPKLAAATICLPHGMVKLPGNKKMSSRLGNIVEANEVIAATEAAAKVQIGQVDKPVVLGAIKYAFLKNRIGSDFVFDINESLSLDGNSGPYLQYAHARARSIILKAKDKPLQNLDKQQLEAGERQLVLKLGEYVEVVARATDELMPHYICTYLYELAQTFNRFYEHNRVIGDPRQPVRLALVNLYATKLKAGLELLGIAAPDKM